MIKKLTSPKVTLKDIAKPKPSRTASRVLRSALKRAHQDQKQVSLKAQALRSH